VSFTTSPRAPGLRERKKAARHAAFVDAARELVRSHGLDGVTIEDICQRVGVSPRTFFNYFASKEDVVLGIGVEDGARSPIPVELVEAFAAGGPSGVLVDDLAALVASILDDPVTGPQRVECVMGIIEAEPRLIGRELRMMEERRIALQSLLERRELTAPTGIAPAVTASLLMAFVRAAVELWNESGQAGRAADYLPTTRDQLRRLVLLGEATPASSPSPNEPKEEPQ